MDRHTAKLNLRRAMVTQILMPSQKSFTLLLFTFLLSCRHRTGCFGLVSRACQAMTQGIHARHPYLNHLWKR